MTGRPRWSALNSYVVGVTACGGVLLLAFAFSGGAAALPHMPAVFWLLSLLMLIGQTSYIVMPSSGRREAITTATCLCLAVVLGWGVAPAALVLAASSVTSDLFRRKEPRKVLFNAAQYAIALAACGAVLAAFGVRPPFDVRNLPPFLLAALAYLFVNKVLVRIAVALHQRIPLDLRRLRGTGVEILPEAILVAMAPLVLVVAERSIWLALLLPLPLIGVHLASRAAVDAEANRAVAEAAVANARVIAAEQARLAQAEQAVARRLQESERLKENLLATVSHELRTPLAGMLGAIATLEQRGHLLTPELRQEFVSMAGRQGKRLRQLIEDLLLAATLEQVPSERLLSPPVDAAFLARKACEQLRRAHPRQPVVASLDGSLPVRAAPDTVLQVLSHLLDNATKHSPESAAIFLEARRRGEHALISVQDAGPGVPLAERERIFERFIRLDGGDTNRRGGGVGLGLYVARQLARSQGGDLRVGEPVAAQAAQAGARFELLLPLASEPVERPPSEPRLAPVTPAAVAEVAAPDAS
jgi:signal transduction histidine kinase